MGGGPPRESLDVPRRKLDRLTERSHAAVRTRGEELGRGCVASELPQKCVLPPAVSHDQDSHAADVTDLSVKGKSAAVARRPASYGCPRREKTFGGKIRMISKMTESFMSICT